MQIARENAPVSRADISRISGLTRATVSALIGVLIKKGFIRETGLNPGSVGKPAIMLDLRDDKLFVLAVKLSYRSIHMAKLDLKGNLHEYSKRPLQKDNRDATIKSLIKMAHKYIEKGLKNDEEYYGIGIAVPSPLKNDAMTNTATFHSMEGINLKECLASEFDLPVSVNNDADAGALAEVWFGDVASGVDLAFVLLQQGIGCGFIRDKELYVHGLKISNEFGHTRIESGGPECFCGKRGCIAAFASDWAIYQNIPDDLKKVINKEVKDAGSSDLEKMMIHMKSHPEVYTKYMKQVSKYLGIGLANLVEMYSPDVIVLEGDLLDVVDMMTEIEKTCDKNMHPVFKDTYKIRRSGLGKNATLIGAGAFLIRKAYNDPFMIEG
jgi:predicted NBD/HSP70 family sugar kinase